MEDDYFFPAQKYSAFTQSVRRFRPSQLLPLLAGMTVREDPNYRDFEEMLLLPPWQSAAIARESIVRGNEHRSATATAEDVRQMAKLYHEVFIEPTKATLTAIAGPLFHEQSWWQVSLFEEQMRTISLFEDSTYGTEFDWTQMLGLPLTDAVRASFIVGLAVNRSGGRWISESLDLLYADPRVEQHAPRRDVEMTAKLLTASIADLRKQGQEYDARRDRDPNLAKHPLNPLLGHPMVDLGADGIWAPVAPLVWRALLPASLYVRGRRQWGESFTTQLGRRYESYVGALLRNVAPDLLGEISYGKGGGQKTVDWIWVTPNAVVLVECKSAGLSIDALAGGGQFSTLVDRYIVGARKQIDRTAAHIVQRTKGLEQIPSDLPVYGLVVTSDPFHLANAGLEEFGEQGAVPSIVASVRAIEHLTSLPGSDAIELLLEVFADPERRSWDLEQALRTHPAEKHPIAAEVWKRVSPSASLRAGKKRTL